MYPLEKHANGVDAQIYRLSAICNFSYMAMVLPMPAFLAATGVSRR
jgi:hypothetical protein